MPSDPSKAGDSKHRLKDKLKVLRWSAKEKLLKNAKTGACAVYHRTGMSLPPALQTFYVDQVVYGSIYAKAHRSYVPRIYSGRALYFKSEDSRERVPQWKKLVPQGLEVRAVPGDHLSMLTEPNLKRLAQILNECLVHAQARACSSTRSSNISRHGQRVARAQ